MDGVRMLNPDGPPPVSSAPVSPHQQQQQHQNRHQQQPRQLDEQPRHQHPYLDQHRQRPRPSAVATPDLLPPLPPAHAATPTPADGSSANGGTGGVGGTTTANTTHLRLRKNGKAQSCEPCRKSKLRCDHNSPCGRCARLGRADKCVFHPAPLARATLLQEQQQQQQQRENQQNQLQPLQQGLKEPSSSLSPPTTIKTASSSSIAAATAAAEATASTAPASVSSTRAATTAASAATAAIRPLKRPATVPSSGLHRPPPAERPQLPRKASNPGVNPLTLGSLGYRRSRGMRPKLFYGQTSHSAILSENRATLGDDGFDELDHDTSSIWCNPHILNYGKAVLDWLPAQDVSEQAVQRYFQISFSISTHEQTVAYFHNSFWAMYGAHLQVPRKPARLLDVAEDLNRKTSVNAIQAPATNAEFLQAFHGRWEAVGLLLLVFGSLAFMLPESDPTLGALIPSDMGKKDYALSMLECADACLILCDELDSQSNMLAVMLFYRCVCLQSLLNVEGDTSLDLWKRAGALLSTITGHGLHQLGPTGPGSILYQEQQKRTFAVSFMWVMSLAAFLGRPPPLSSRYALTPPPLDVSDDALMHDDLAAVVAVGLDDNGWNVHNKIHPATLCRAGYMSSFMYEEILEISLGSQSQDPYAISARIRSLRVKLQAYQDQLPPIFRTPVAKATFDARTAWEVCGIVQIQLANLHQLFLMERIDHPEKDEQRHLEAAHRMLNIIVVMWNERDRVPEHFDELHWYITCYGIPSASALGISLWKQAHAPQDHPPSRHRSDVIMNLSVFLACLDWIPPHDGNFVLCRRSRKMIRHILDGILAPQQPPSSSGSGSAKPAPDQLADPDLSPFDFANMPDMPGFSAGLDDWFMADWASAPRLDFN